MSKNSVIEFFFSNHINDSALNGKETVEVSLAKYMKLLKTKEAYDSIVHALDGIENAIKGSIPGDTHVKVYLGNHTMEGVVSFLTTEEMHKVYKDRIDALNKELSEVRAVNTGWADKSEFDYRYYQGLVEEEKKTSAIKDALIRDLKRCIYERNSSLLGAFLPVKLTFSSDFSLKEYQKTHLVN